MWWIQCSTKWGEIRWMRRGWPSLLRTGERPCGTCKALIFLACLEPDLTKKWSNWVRARSCQTNPMSSYPDSLGLWSGGKRDKKWVVVELWLWCQDIRISNKSLPQIWLRRCKLNLNPNSCQLSLSKKRLRLFLKNQRKRTIPIWSREGLLWNNSSLRFRLDASR